MNIDDHRANCNYSKLIWCKRLLWVIVQPFFRFNPFFQGQGLFFNWRNFLLRLFGAKIGKNVRIHSKAEIYFPWNITIENNVTISWNVILYSLGNIVIKEGCMISQYCHLCAGTHDYNKSNFPLIFQDITVGKKVWIATDSYIAPGVTIGENSIIGARSSVYQDVGAGLIIGGNPAKTIKKR